MKRTSGKHDGKATRANRTTAVARKSLILAAIAFGAIGLPGCSATDDRPALWEYISPAIVQPNCATSSCHSRAAAVAGLDFSDPERGYVSLTGLWVWIVDPNGTADQGCRPVNGTVACQRPNRPMVTPFDPAQSRVVNMLRARGAPRMPPDRPIPEADIALIERWILNGAARTVGGAASSDAAADRSPADASDGRAGDASDDTGVDAPDAGTSTDASDARDASGDPQS